MTDTEPGKYKKFDQVLGELKAQIDSLALQETQIGPLNKAYENLERQSSDIQKVEEHIDEIRRQVIDPVNQSLGKANRAAWLFGVVGVLVGVSGIAFSLFHNPNRATLEKIESAQRNIADAENNQSKVIREVREIEASHQRMLADLLSIGKSKQYVPTSVASIEGERILPRFQVVPVLSGTDNEVALRLKDVRSETPVGSEEKQLTAEFELHQDGTKQAQSEIDRRIRVESTWSLPDGPKDHDTFKAFENDVIVIDEIHRIALIRVMSEEPLHRAAGDSGTTAILLSQ